MHLITQRHSKRLLSAEGEQTGACGGVTLGQLSLLVPHKKTDTKRTVTHIFFVQMPIFWSLLTGQWARIPMSTWAPPLRISQHTSDLLRP